MYPKEHLVAKSRCHMLEKLSAQNAVRNVKRAKNPKNSRNRRKLRLRLQNDKPLVFELGSNETTNIVDNVYRAAMTVTAPTASSKPGKCPAAELHIPKNRLPMRKVG